MIHVLYPSLRELIATLMLRFMKTEVVANRTGIELQKINVHDVGNMQPLLKVEIGEGTRKAMMKMVKAEQHNGMLLEMRNFLVWCRVHAKKFAAG